MKRTRRLTTWQRRQRDSYGRHDDGEFGFADRCQAVVRSRVTSYGRLALEECVEH
jgi:hypothetical protein